MFDGTAVFESCTIAGNNSYENGGGCLSGTDMRICIAAPSLQHRRGSGGRYFLIQSSFRFGDAEKLYPVESKCCRSRGKNHLCRYSDVEGGYTGTGNINQEPRFVNAPGGDYHLLWDSLCIDAGDPAYIPQASEQDIDKEPRMMRNSRIDMGSDEVGLKQTDFTRNGAVNLLDLSMFMSSWLTGKRMKTGIDFVT